MGAILNPEVSDFHKIIGPRYVDKTELIAYTNSVMETDLKLICFSRPRRFGKSYAAKMLAAFYSKGADWRADIRGTRTGWPRSTLKSSDEAR